MLRVGFEVDPQVASASSERQRRGGRLTRLVGRQRVRRRYHTIHTHSMQSHFDDTQVLNDARTGRVVHEEGISFSTGNEV